MHWRWPIAKRPKLPTHLLHALFTYVNILKPKRIGQSDWIGTRVTEQIQPASNPRRIGLPVPAPPRAVPSKHIVASLRRAVSSRVELLGHLPGQAQRLVHIA